MGASTFTFEDFLEASKDFIRISNSICDGWKLFENQDVHNTYIRKEAFLNCNSKNLSEILKTEYVIHYNINYGVPTFSFNIWNSFGKLISLEEIRKISVLRIDEDKFYSVITQQEHPIFFRPYFVVHPCHTATLLTTFKTKSKNLIVTFLSLITPLLNLNLPLEYGL